MFSEERLKLIRFLEQNGINAHAFSDAEIRQQAQRVISTWKLKMEVKTKPGKKNPLSIKKGPRM